MARRTLNRKELRADYDAAERRKEDEDEDVEDEDEEEDEDEDSGDEESDGEASDEADDEDEPEKKPAKKKKPAKEPKKPRSRSRAAKIVRMKVVWGVFDNSSRRVAVFDYPKRKEADEMAAKLRADKKSTYFVQPVKEPIEEKAEAK